MIIKETYRAILFFLTIVLPLLHSCDIDQVENNYSNFELAEKDGLFEKGWIPSEIVFTSMTEIYQRTNVDLNTCIFSYNLSKTDLEILKHKIIPIATQFEKPHRIRIPI